MYYFFAYKQQLGCPAYLRTLLHDSIEAALKEEPMSYAWAYPQPGEAFASVPKELWMIAKHKKYDFDIKADFDGFIVSDLFVNIMKNHDVGFWEKAKVHVQLKNGKKVSEKQYWYIRQADKFKAIPEDIIDIELSDIYLRKDGTVRQMKSLVIKDNNKLDLFMLNDNYNYLFCSQNFADVAQYLKGCQLLPATNLKPENVVLI